jgi:hypothetical protein
MLATAGTKPFLIRKSKLRPGIRQERYPKENISNGKFLKDNHPTTALRKLIGSFGDKEKT